MCDLLFYLKLYKKYWFGFIFGMLLVLLIVFVLIGLLMLFGWFLFVVVVVGFSIVWEIFNYMLFGVFVCGFVMGCIVGCWGECVVIYNVIFKLFIDLWVFFFEKLILFILGCLSVVCDVDMFNCIVVDVDVMDYVYLCLINLVMVGVLGIVVFIILIVWFDL